jgi:hypothetical protein
VTTVNRYRIEVPRLLCGLAAMALSTLTIGALVVLPTRIETEGQKDIVLAFSPVAAAQCVIATPEHRSEDAE